MTTRFSFLAKYFNLLYLIPNRIFKILVFIVLFRFYPLLAQQAINPLIFADVPAVSYTHLDVYKRQVTACMNMVPITGGPISSSMKMGSGQNDYQCTGHWTPNGYRLTLLI